MNRNTPTVVVERPTLQQTVEGMRKFANEGKQDLEVVQLARNICQGLVGGDYASERLAICHWVYANIRYVRDIHDVEFVQSPRITLEQRCGDCDDMTTLIAALVMAIGNPCQFVLISFTLPPNFSHVYLQVPTVHGPHVLDPVANMKMAEMARMAKAKVVIPV